MASAHSRDFYTNWDVPGVYLVTVPQIEPGTFLANLGVRFEGCDSAAVRPFENATVSGLVQEWTGCGNDSPSTAFTFALSPRDESMTVFGFVKLPDGDATPLGVVLSSIELLSPSARLAAQIS